MQTQSTDFTRSEWDLLTRLPGRIVVIVIAVISAESDKSRSVAEGLAGLDAIAAGRTSDNELVRRVVSAMYAEDDSDVPAPDQFTEPGHCLAQVLADCRAAAEVLKDPSTRQAYSAWLTSIGSRVCQAARPDGALSPDGARGSTAEVNFLTDLEAAFRP